MSIKSVSNGFGVESQRASSSLDLESSSVVSLEELPDQAADRDLHDLTIKLSKMDISQWNMGFGRIEAILARLGNSENAPEEKAQTNSSQTSAFCLNLEIPRISTAPDKLEDSQETSDSNETSDPELTETDEEELPSKRARLDSSKQEAITMGGNRYGLESEGSRLAFDAIIDHLQSANIRCGCPKKHVIQKKDPECKKPFSSRAIDNVIPPTLVQKFINASEGNAARRKLTLVRKLNQELELNVKLQNVKSLALVNKIVNFCLEHELCGCVTGCDKDSSCRRFTLVPLVKKLEELGSKSLIEELVRFRSKPMSTQTSLMKRINKLFFEFQRKFEQAVSSHQGPQIG